MVIRYDEKLKCYRTFQDESYEPSKILSEPSTEELRPSKEQQEEIKRLLDWPKRFDPDYIIGVPNGGK